MSRFARLCWFWLLAAWWLAMAIGSHWPRLDIVETFHTPQTMLGLGMDKWFHISCYAGLAVLGLQWGGLGGKSRWPVLRTWLILFIYSSIDEPTQYFSPGREVSWDDWFASNTGLALGTMAWTTVRFLTTHDNSFIAHTRIVSALTLLSRMFGLVRDGVLARVFGLHGVFDAFNMANTIPNLFRRLFGEGALSAAFIPLYTKLNQQDPAAGKRFAATVVGVMMVGLTILAVVIAAALWIVAASFHLDDRNELVLKLTVITILYMPLICCAAVLGGLLQVHNKFGVMAASPILQNLILISSAAVGYYAIWGSAGQTQLAVLVSAAVVVSGLAQLTWALLAMRKLGIGTRQIIAMSMDLRGSLAIPEIRTALVNLWRQAWPTALGLSVFQLNALMDQVIAFVFSSTPGKGEMFTVFGHALRYPMQEGSAAAMGRAQLLYEFPHGVFGIAVATAIFPALAKAANEPQRFAALLRQGLRLTMFIGLPASAGLILLRDPLCQAIFYKGDQLRPEDAGRIAWILLGFATAIWSYSTNVLLTRAFYAQHNTITPMRLSVSMVGLNIVGNLSLIWIPGLGAAGLAWSTSICAMIQTAILLRLVRRYVPTPINADVRRGWMRSALLTLIMSAVLAPALHLVTLDSMSRTQVIAVLLGGTAVGGIIVLVGARLMGMAELRWLISRSAEPDPEPAEEAAAIDGI